MTKISLADHAANKIRTLILESQLMPGTHINIDVISKQFGISQTPVREALKRLIVEGLAVYTPKVGYAVRSLTLHEYLQVSEIHQVLEVYLVRELAKTPFLVDTESIEKINDSIGQSVADNNIDGIAEANDAFHKKLYENYHNKIMLNRLFDLWNEVRSLRNIMYKNSVFTNRIMEEHRRIIYAIRSENPSAAEKAMNEHYRSGRESAIISFPVGY